MPEPELVTTGRALQARARRAHYRDRDVGLAWQLYEQALGELEREGDPRGAAEVVIDLANLRTEQGWWSDAVSLLHEARQRVGRAGLSGFAVPLDTLTGEIALRSGDRDGAARAFARALATAERSGDELGRVLMQSARTFQDDGDFAEAAQRLERAVGELARSGDARRSTLARIRLGLVAIERGDASGAIAMLDAARATCTADSDPLVVREAWLYSCAACALAGRFTDASAALAAAGAIPASWTSSRHSRHVLAVFEALVAACRATATQPFDRGLLDLARDAIIAAEAPGADGGSAVNCFYIVRACVRLIRRAVPLETLPIGRTRIAEDGSWFQLVDGRTVELAHRPVLARILAGLARACASSARTATVEMLLDAGWPGQASIGTSGELRVYTSISRLRKLGLRDLITADPAGYRIDAEVVALDP